LAKIFGYEVFMIRVQIGELRDNISRFVRRAAAGESIVILNRDREVAVLGPRHPARRKRRRLLGCMKGTARIVGDIVAPVIPESDWFRS
jgi:antitoxin (DNA-binding transcriptional repressor) of toxin-antitoxin stability system